MKFCGPGFIPEPTLLRKLKEELASSQSLLVNDPENERVLGYLLEKGLVGKVGKVARKGARYRYTLERSDTGWRAHGSNDQPLERIDVARVDIAMSDARVVSTVGTPTPDNANEVLELTYQLGLVTKAKRNMTAAGQALNGLRQRSGGGNPFVVGLEAVIFMRQLVEHDGMMMKLFTEALAVEDSPINRSHFATGKFPELVERLVEEVDGARLRPEVRSEARAFRELVRKTTQKATRSASSRPGASKARGPGVLEHRVSPRFEWLCDLRVLSKEGLASNAFSYIPTDDLQLLVSCLADEPGLQAGADEVSLEWWRGSEGFSREREECESYDTREALLVAYRMMQRTIGPAAIREITLLACLFARDPLRVSEMESALIEWAASETRITLSGGRYRRQPELVHIPRAIANGEAT